MRICLTALGLVVLLLSACGREELTQNTGDYDRLGGTWEVSGTYYNGHLIDIHDVEGLEDLYDTKTLTFREDGTFLYYNTFNSRGPYRPAEAENTYLLTTETVTRFTFDDNRELTEVEAETDSKSVYLVTLLDENTLQFAYYDPMVGQPKTDSDPLIFTLEGAESDYINRNKTPVTTTNQEAPQPTDRQEPPDTHPSAGGRYQDILEEYTRRMESSVDRLVQEYWTEAAGVSDLGRKAEICNDKVGALAEICNEGIGEMAERMYRIGDPYSTYERWASALQEQYTDIAMAIQDAYMDSAF